MAASARRSPAWVNRLQDETGASKGLRTRTKEAARLLRDLFPLLPFYLHWQIGCRLQEQSQVWPAEHEAEPELAPQLREQLLVWATCASGALFGVFGLIT